MKPNNVLLANDVFFSIILPVFNREEMVSRGIESVLQQDFSFWELIVVDDGSTDGTRKVVESYSNDPRLRYVYQQNAERSVARNNGMRLSSGDFFCFIDSDDFYLKNHLSELYKTIAANDFKEALYYTHYYKEISGKRVEAKKFSEIRNKGLYNIFYESLLQTNSVCIHKNLVKDHQFPVEFNLFEDNHLWIRVIALSELVYIETPTTVVVEHGSRSLRTDKEGLLKKVEKYEAVLTHLLLQGRYPFLDKYLSLKDCKRFLASKFIVLAYEALLIKEVFLTYKLLFKSLYVEIDLKRIPEYIKLLVGIPFYVLIKKGKNYL
jgi:glycosyltransferase involved in cell wall biosynthesis